MAQHNSWLKKGFDAGVFLLAGSLQPRFGGAIVAHNTSLPEPEERLGGDPFVTEKVVTSDILDITPAKNRPVAGFPARIARFNIHHSTRSPDE